MYEYGARNYDAAVGRFFNIDRLSEKYEALSPYNYTANNPVRFVDIDGEWIDIFDGDNRYRYISGGDVKQLDKKTGTWSIVEDKTSLSFYVQEVICNLYELESSGSTGGAVIGYFNNNSRQANFRGYSDNERTYANPAGSVYTRNGFAVNDIMTVEGLSKDGFIGSKEATRMFLTFGHELAHIIDKYENPDYYQNIWMDLGPGKESIKRSEIFASHIENQIRAQSGYPLRQYYGLSKDAHTGKNTGMRGTLLLDNNNNSLYFKQTKPSIFDIKNRGEIIKQKIEQIKIKDGRYSY